MLVDIHAVEIQPTNPAAVFTAAVATVAAFHCLQYDFFAINQMTQMFQGSQSRWTLIASCFRCNDRGQSDALLLDPGVKPRLDSHRITVDNVHDGCSFPASHNT